MSAPLVFPDRFLEVEGVRTRYWDEGQGGVPVVLVHGYSGSVLTWKPLIADLARDHRVLAFDAPGHGLTDLPDLVPDLEYLAGFLRAFLRALGLDRVVLMGYSLGGAAALRFTLDHPELVDRLALVAPAVAGQMDATLRLASVPGLGELLAPRPRSREALQASYRSLTFAPYAYDPDELDQYLGFQGRPGYLGFQLAILRQSVNPAGASRKYRAFLRRLADEAPRWRFPILVVWGRQDRVVPHIWAEPLLAHWPQAARWEPDACGHGAIWEYPAEFQRRVRAFVGSPAMAAAIV